DYAGASLDRKSTTRGCQFLGCRLISWQCKKQTVVATSPTEADMWLLLVVVDKYSGFKIKCWIMGIILCTLERISKKRTKNEAKSTKPDTEWKSVEKTQSNPSPSVKKKVNNKSTPTNPKPKSQEIQV
ncbi:hypothetical protein Tco_0264019, partial [Tanacetum coccineum]